LEGDLTQINEQVINERQDESSLRGRQQVKNNAAQDEGLALEHLKPHSQSILKTEDDRQNTEQQ